VTPVDDLPPLREVIRRHELMAKRSLGQNFLLDLNLTAKIARAGGDLEGATVVEVGPGPGGLTRALLAGGAARVVAVERDARCLPALEEIAGHYPGRLEIHAGDALEVVWGSLLAGVDGAIRIVANLPYNVATPLLIGWLKTEPWPPWWQSMTLMFQKEVAQRIVAGAGDDAYGRLSVLARWRTTSEVVFDVPPGAFTPAPKVTSSLVHFRPRVEPLPCRVGDLERVTQAAFGQRRKMLRQSLKSLGPAAVAAIAASGLRPQMRAEEVPVEGFVALANALAASDVARPPG
jgi:16S rRNA (adenine1518-N6/adenine1519-N6)-dimethyltransferase